MKKKEFLECIFYSTMILLGFVVCFEIFSDAMKNIKLKNKLREDSVCIKIDNELYCRLDYNIIINEPRKA